MSSPPAPTEVALGNDAPKDSDETLTVLVRHHVRHDKHEAFKNWSQDTNALVRKFDGFINSEIIRPNNTTVDLESATPSGTDEYVAIVRFDNYAHLNVWMKSDERKGMVDRISEFADDEPEVTFHSLEHWFVSADDAPKKGPGGPPAKWKMVIVTVAIIYTQTLWVPKLTRPIIPKSAHPYLYQLFNIVIVVLLSTFIFFPVVTRLVSFWLTPGVDYKAKVLELVPSAFKKPAGKPKV